MSAFDCPGCGFRMLAMELSSLRVPMDCPRCGEHSTSEYVAVPTPPPPPTPPAEPNYNHGGPGVCRLCYPSGEPGKQGKLL